MKLITSPGMMPAVLLSSAMPVRQSAPAVIMSSMLHCSFSSASSASSTVMILVRLAGERCCSMFLEYMMSPVSRSASTMAWAWVWGSSSASAAGAAKLKIRDISSRRGKILNFFIFCSRFYLIMVYYNQVYGYSSAHYNVLR